MDYANIAALSGAGCKSDFSWNTKAQGGEGGKQSHGRDSRIHLETPTCRNLFCLYRLVLFLASVLALFYQTDT